MKRAARVVSITLAVSLSSLPAESFAAPSRSSIDQCIAASENSQVERSKGHLRAAREVLSRCLAADCPALISKDCNAFLAQLEAITPTVVFRVLDASGRDFVDAQVRVDGELVMSRIDGRARPLDPGPHDVEVRAPNQPVLTQRIVAEEGVKARVIELRFSSPATTMTSSPAVTPTPSVAPTPAPPSSSDRPESSGPATGTIVTSAALAGLGVVGLGAFTLVGLKANSDYDRLQSTCGSRCAPDEVDRVHGRYQLADVALAVGIGALAGAALVFLLGPRESAAARTGIAPPTPRF